MTHPTVAITGRKIHHLVAGRLVARDGEIHLLREFLITVPMQPPEIEIDAEVISFIRSHGTRARYNIGICSRASVGSATRSGISILNASFGYQTALEVRNKLILGAEASWITRCLFSVTVHRVDAIEAN